MKKYIKDVEYFLENQKEIKITLILIRGSIR